MGLRFQTTSDLHWLIGTPVPQQQSTDLYDQQQSKRSLWSITPPNDLYGLSPRPDLYGQHRQPGLYCPTPKPIFMITMTTEHSATDRPAISATCRQGPSTTRPLCHLTQVPRQVLPQKFCCFRFSQRKLLRSPERSFLI